MIKCRALKATEKILESDEETRGNFLYSPGTSYAACMYEEKCKFNARKLNFGC